MTALFIAIGSSVLGVFVIIRRLSAIGAGISHLSFASVALALSLNLEPATFSAIIAAFSAIFLRSLSLKQGIPADASVAVLFALGPAIATLLIAKGDFSPGELNSILYGSLLQAGKFDILLGLFVCLASLVFVKMYFRALILLSLSQELARLKGIRIKTVEYALSILTGISIAVSIKAVGILLSSSLIVIPSLAGILLSSSLKSAAITSALISAFGVIVGMLISIELDIPPSSSIVGIYLIALILSTFKKGG